MDGLLRSEFALVLRDSLNSTPRRHVVSPAPAGAAAAAASPPAPLPAQAGSPQKKPRAAAEFAMPCDMTLEPRLHLSAIPTSPTSPLPAGKPGDAAGMLPSPRRLGFVAAAAGAGGEAIPRSPVSPIVKQRRRASADASSSARRQLSSALAAAAADAPLEFLAAVSAQQDVARERPAQVVRQLPMSPVNSEGSGAIERKRSGRREKGKAGNGGRVFACKQCSSTFSQQFNLNKHVRAVHERRRPFECEVCHARFQQKSHRTMHHLAVHEKLRQFGCDQCNASFSWRGVLKKHRKSIHGLDD